MKELQRAHWALAAVCFFWGTTYIAIRIGVHAVPPFLFSSVRFSLAGSALLLYALWRGEPLPRGPEWGRLALTAFMLLAVGNGTLSWASQWVPAGIASLVVVSTPFWMVGFARAAGERISPQAVAGLLLGFCGLAILLWPDLRAGASGPRFLQGVLLLLGSSALWAYASVHVKNRPLTSSPLMTVAMQKLFAGLFVFLAALAAGEPPRWHPNAAAWLSILYLAVFGSIIGYTCYVYALARLPTEQVSIYAYVNPIVAVLLGVLLLGERLDPFVLVGGPLVLWGIFLVNTARRAKSPAPAPPQ